MSTESTPMTLETLTGELAQVVTEKGHLTTALGVMSKRESELRDSFHALMQTSGVKTADTPYARVQRKQGHRVTVTDRAQLEAALAESGLLDSVQKTTVALDLNAAKKLGLEREMPGVEKVPYDELAVTLVEVS